MAIPSKSPLYIVSSLRCIPTNDIFNSPCCYMAIVGSAGGKRRSIVKCIMRKMPGLFQLLLKRIDIFPILDDCFFFFRKGNLFRGYMMGKKRILNVANC